MAGYHPSTLPSPTDRIQFDLADSSEDHYVQLLRTHPDVRRHLPQFPADFSLDDAVALREKRSADPGYADYHIHSIQDGTRTFMGVVSLKNMDMFHKSCEAGVLLMPSAQGKGIATVAFYVLFVYLFEERGMHRVVLDTSVENKAMRGWLEGVAGAKLEATLRDQWNSTENPGTYTDVVVYGILEEEWRGDMKERLQAKLRR